MKKYLVIALCAIALSPLAAVHAESGRGSEGEVRGGIKLNLFGGHKDDADENEMDSDHDRAEAEAKLRFGTDDGMKNKNDVGQRGLFSNDNGLHLGWKMRLEAHKRFDVAVNRFDKIVTRVDSRIAKIKAEGKNTSTAEAFMLTAKANIADAKNIQVQMKAIVAAHPTNTDVTDAEKTQLKALAEREKTALKSALENIMNAVKELRKIDVSTTSNTNASVN